MRVARSPAQYVEHERPEYRSIGLLITAPGRSRSTYCTVASRSEAVGEPSGLGLRGFQHGAGDGSDRGSFSKSLGYRVKGDWGKARRIENREDGFPPLRLKFSFKRVQPIKVVEAPAVRLRPGKQPAQPERIFLSRDRGAP